MLSAGAAVCRQERLRAMYILNVLAPVFLVIALGAALKRTGFVSDEALGSMSRLADLSGVRSEWGQTLISD